MAEDALPGEVRELIAEHVETFEHLEVLLLVARELRRGWTPANVAAELKLDERLMADVLRDLERRGLLVCTSAEPATYETHPAAVPGLEGLLAACASDRTAVMKVMTTNALNRIRTSALRAFASAFLLGRKRDG